MSALQDLAAQLRAGARQLPADAVIAAADRLTVASELLAWVRRSSSHPLGLPELARAVEHLEHALYGLRATSDAVDAYLAVLGLERRPPSIPFGEIRQPETPDQQTDRPQDPKPAMPLLRWWAARVDHLMRPEGEDAPPSASSPPGSGDRTTRSGPKDSTDLLRRVAQVVRQNDRDRLRSELRNVEPPIGLGLSAISPAVLRCLATEYLGEPPRPQDLTRLRQATDARLLALLPGIDPAVSTTLLSRLCTSGRQIPEESQQAGREGGHHPADAAVANAVLVGLMLERLGKPPDTIPPAPTSTTAPASTTTPASTTAPGTSHG